MSSAQLCPACDHFAARLDDKSSGASVNSYRCDDCGHQWTTAKNSEAIVGHVPPLTGSQAVTELATKPCVAPDCDGTMSYSLRVVPVGGGFTPSPGWVCDSNPEHIAWEVLPHEVR